MGGGGGSDLSIIMTLNVICERPLNVRFVHTSGILYNYINLYYRLIILRKKPTLLKFLCALVVFIALILSLIPVITGMDKGSKEGKQVWLQQSAVSRILWPLCFMLGFVSCVQCKSAIVWLLWGKSGLF